MEKGHTNNPNGRPKRVKLWQESIERAIKRRQQDDPQALEKLADVLIEKVLTGDVPAIKEFGDRVDGKVPQAIVGDDSEDPITFHSIDDISILKRAAKRIMGD